MGLNGKNNAEMIWNYLMAKYNNPYGVAGLMGNLYAESGLVPTNLQNTFEKKLGHTDASYTKAVDDGSYTNFVRDSAGYGLAQWTYWSRKQNLLDFSKKKKKSIGDLEMQLEFLCNELAGYKEVIDAIKNGKSVKEVSNIVLFKFERPANQGESVQNKRAGYGQVYYDQFVGQTKLNENLNEEIKFRVRTSWLDAKSQIGAYSNLDNAKKMADSHPGYKVYDKNGKEVYAPAEKSFSPYLVRVKRSDLNIRKGPGTKYGTNGRIPVGTYTIVAEESGVGSVLGWGKLKSGAGWISLDYVEKK